MNKPNEHELDALLRKHMSAELGPQLGSATHHFEHHIAVQRRWRTWTWTGLGAALAAGVALAVLLNTDRVKPRPDQPLTIVQGNGSPRSMSEAKLTVVSQSFDDGTVMVQGQRPARQFRRQVVETAQWTDPRYDAHVRVTIPRKQVVLVGLQEQ